MQNHDPNQPPPNPGYAPIPPPTGEYGGYYQQGPTTSAANSGMGAASVLPEELKGFNWGAFLLNWIWSIGHNTWIGLLSLIPYVGFVMAIVLGFKGNEWAWQNRKWDSIEQFKAVQTKWRQWALGLILLWLLFVVGIAVLTVMGQRLRSGYQPQTTSIGQ